MSHFNEQCMAHTKGSIVHCIASPVGKGSQGGLLERTNLLHSIFTMCLMFLQCLDQVPLLLEPTEDVGKPYGGVPGPAHMSPWA